ncbi:hypothetical protein DRF65_17310, partial [Chryseobacterium pennae]
IQWGGFFEAAPLYYQDLLRAITKLFYSIQAILLLPWTQSAPFGTSRYHVTRACIIIPASN